MADDETKAKEQEVKELKERALKLESDLAEARRAAKNAPTDKKAEAWEKTASELKAAIDEIRAEIQALKPKTPALITPAPKKSVEPWD